MMSPVRLLFSTISLMLLACPGIAQTQKFVSHFPIEAPEVPAAVRAEARSVPWQDAERGPVDGLKIFAREKSGAIWLGSDLGAARFDPHAKFRWDRWQYFYGRRWLPGDKVLNIWVDESDQGRRVWVRTEKGVSLIEWRPMTLGEKAKYFDERIEQRHVRHGLVAGSHLRVAGDLSSNERFSNDNDGLWTAIYLGAQAFRYAVTHEPDARAKARRALQALMRLEEITGIPGLPARSFVSAEEPLPKSGEWHPTPEGKWHWKGDTSSDELVGHYFAYAAYFDLVADDGEKEAIRKVVSRITDYLIKNDYDLIDVTGKPTRWGEYSERFFQTAEGKYEAPLRSLELLSFLKTAQHITGDKKYAEAYQDRIRRGYADHVPYYRRWPGGGEINFSDDELAYLSYEPLLKYEKSSRLRKIYLDGLRFTWGQVRSDTNPLWNYISVAGGGGRMTPEVREESQRTLERIPLDLIEWGVRNSHRIDVQFQKEKDRHGHLQLTEVLAPDERAVGKWNGNPYIPDSGGAGHGEDDGAYFLLPYWMGRYYDWVK
ncbi:MAG: hypothetical protein DME22_08340 [Verrucomicrobia bacterium]|nr:MAG: hypothetical protein DME22_08340 [Verrucomicrobiota bacterium]PYK01378.1 MAG: hypothetical protein DME23_04235 [Verrucomicrobiota bacterium]